jgi:hypothetical protein
MARSTIAVVGVSESSALAASCGRSSKEDYDHLLGELSEHYKYLLKEEEDKMTVDAEEFLGECLPLLLLLAFLSLSHYQSLSCRLLGLSCASAHRRSPSGCQKDKLRSASSSSDSRSPGRALSSAQDGVS